MINIQEFKKEYTGDIFYASGNIKPGYRWSIETYEPGSNLITYIKEVHRKSGKVQYTNYKNKIVYLFNHLGYIEHGGFNIALDLQSFIINDELDLIITELKGSVPEQ